MTQRMYLTCALGAILLIATGALLSSHAAAGPANRGFEPFPDASGEVQTLSVGGALNQQGPFFQAQGTNGRSCVTCHSNRTAWALAPWEVQQRYLQSAGTDPLFRPVDGATCPNDDFSTPGARLSAYRLLLSKGLIRIGLTVPANADFTITAVDTPYSCADTQNVSVYRRPLPATNLRFLTTVMWDGRESPAGNTLNDSLRSQAFDAIMGHEQAATAPSNAVLDRIVAFERSLYTAQVLDHAAGRLETEGARGGPEPLMQQPFSIGINNLDAQGQPGTPDVFDLYRAWNHSNQPDRQSVARGEAIFNTRPITISGVAGLNDALGLPVIPGTCSTCHNTPNVGDHSVPGPLNIGIAAASERTPDLPLFTVQCNDGSTVQTTDLGRALVSGRCADIGKFKGPILRALAARAPYFHNGSAATLTDVLNFYDTRFNIGMSAQQKSDLAAFLSAL